jgi:hypothetical protein
MMAFFIMTTMYFAQHSQLFDSIDFGKVEGGYYCILETNNILDVHKMIDKMKAKFNKIHNKCIGCSGSRIIISRFSGKNLEMIYDTDININNNKSVDNYELVQSKLEWSNITMFNDSLDFP